MKSNFESWECMYNSVCGYLNMDLVSNFDFMYGKTWTML